MYEFRASRILLFSTQAVGVIVACEHERIRQLEHAPCNAHQTHPTYLIRPSCALSKGCDFEPGLVSILMGKTP